ncbi:MAG TPA: hypothetical protein VLA41_07785 [Burkholderiales bacterium]|nr:hypothetical protein [Burkholderiales bacterium]
MVRLSWWLRRGALAVALAMSMAAMAGCASNGAPADQQDKQRERPPGYVPFSA